MALPAVPAGYTSWNDYIETNAPGLVGPGLTLQEAKAQLKLSLVSAPIRSAVGQPYYRQLHTFTTWSARTVLPFVGRPWA